VNIEQIIFDVAEALRYPVLVLALLSLAVVLVEAGAFAVEVVRRRRRDTARLERVAETARAALAGGDVPGARRALSQIAWSGAMAATLELIAERIRAGGGGDRVAKALADFDFASLRRLERTRVLVRAGPALGLMGTLIPLSPALTGLANGNTGALSQNLRIAFSVTVVGLLIGAVAFGLSLSRDRMYGQDLSDLEYLAAIMSDPRPAGGAT
jgi:biopolymer transport protein ExbB/TolQ